MTAIEIRNKFLNFFKENGHVIIPGASLIPDNNSSVLFNIAGMQQLIPYFLGEKHPAGTRIADYQKCIRTNDIEEVGDNRHLTCFEMLGNWSLGDYFKKESIMMSYNFLTKELNIPAEKLSVTCFKGDKDAPKDEETAKYWNHIGIPKERIFFFGKEDNWWIAGEEGPCGPDTEIFFDTGKEKCSAECNPSCDCGKYIEIWNNVFMEYFKDKNGYTPLKQKNVDTGLGLERINMLLQGKESVFDTEIFVPIMEKIRELSNNYNVISARIISDHIRASLMLIVDGARPSNVDQGYVLRRLIRRLVRHMKKLEIPFECLKEITNTTIATLKEMYPELDMNKNILIEELEKEKHKFILTLEKGEKEFAKIIEKVNPQTDKIPAEIVFKLYDTYGFPPEITEELAKEYSHNIDMEGFNQLFKKHQEISRAGAEQKFKGGLAGTGEIEIKYHTATHLLNAALKLVLGKDTHQRGSNITAERMRFDFNCDHKMTDEEKEKTEQIVNQWIEQDLSVTVEQMSKEDAINSGAECMFIEKYPDVVTVYSIGEISKELCGGPHVKSTKELGKFSISKEEASSAGIRRIKAILVK